MSKHTLLGGCVACRVVTLCLMMTNRIPIHLLFTVRMNFPVFSYSVYYFLSRFKPGLGCVSTYIYSPYCSVNSAIFQHSFLVLPQIYYTTVNKSQSVYHIPKIFSLMSISLQFDVYELSCHMSWSVLLRMMLKAVSELFYSVWNGNSDGDLTTVYCTNVVNELKIVSFIRN